MEGPQQKKIRYQDPDVTVVVGDGDAQKKYECYLVQLCLRCPYIDAMMSNQVEMRENSTREIVLLDLKPSQWELLYGFIVPPVNPELHPRVNEENVQILVTLFHRFQMSAHLDLCDDFISAKITESCGGDKAISTRSVDVDFWSKIGDKDRAECFSNIVNSLQLAVTYGMRKTLSATLDAISGFLSHLEYTGDLFNVEVVSDLVESLSPLYVEGGIDEGGEDERTAEEPKKMTRDILVKLIPREYLPASGGDALGSKVLSLLVHASIQREAAETKAARLRVDAATKSLSSACSTLRLASRAMESCTKRGDSQRTPEILTLGLFAVRAAESASSQLKSVSIERCVAKKHLCNLKRKLNDSWIDPDPNRVCGICLNYLNVPSIEYDANPKNEDGLYVSSSGNCSHKFHSDCMTRWLRTRPACPDCNKKWKTNKKESIIPGENNLSL